MPAAIEISNFTKIYPGTKVPAVSDLSISIDRGEVYGFLGSNGAGKSTTIRTLMNFLLPTRGSITIFGRDSVRDSTILKKHIGYLSGDVALYHSVTGRQLLDYLSKLQGTTDRTYLDTLCERFEAELDKRISDLSKGNRQKIGLIQALIHQPDILILDEPTSGLDPLMQERFYETIREAKARGAAVFLSSHSLPEVQHICDRVGIIKNGKLVREGSMSELTADTRPVLAVTFAGPDAAAAISKSKAVQILDKNGSVVRLQPTGTISDALATISKFDIIALDTENAQLEDQFMSYYETEEDTP